MAAPYATASSGFTPLAGSLFLKISCTSFLTYGIRVDPPTSTMESTSDVRVSVSSRTVLMGAAHFLNRSLFSSSNLARVSVSLKSMPSMMAGISMTTFVSFESLRLAASASRRSFARARSDVVKSLSSFSLKRLINQSIMRWSKSAPPRCVSPAVASTRNSPLSILSKDTSKVPPPRSKTSTRRAFSLRSRPYAMAAAVGSFSTRRTLSPAIRPASFVA
mmetsp:Transcript_21530/g.64061  ORF Transcript_21530/g.64061 Transcript_21530/m.64061 type:complete len:219 (+) Transcript_21530:1218-1874(+)